MLMELRKRSTKVNKIPCSYGRDYTEESIIEKFTAKLISGSEQNKQGASSGGRVRNVRTPALLMTFLLPTTMLLYAASSQARTTGRTPRSAAAKSSATVGKKAISAGFSHDVLPVVQKYCLGCHSGKSAAAGIDLSTAKDASSVSKNRSMWDRVTQNIGSNRMPPAGSPAPTKAQRDTLVNWIQTTTTSADCLLNDPGHVTLRRLNRAEYNNTVRDLCGVDIHPADAFPNDDVGYGFDNIGDVLSISPLLMEKYVAVAAKVAHATMGGQSKLMEQLDTFDPPDATRSTVARKFLTYFVQRAYRRPAAKDDVDRLVHYVELAHSQGETFQQGMEYAMTAAMCSPNFLFRIETNIPGVPLAPAPVKGSGKRGSKVRLHVAHSKSGTDGSLLNDFALASRLSYFLWSSMPDDELYNLAAKGKLHDPTVLVAQAKRMLKDPRAGALADNFAGQWLQLRNLANVSPDTKRFTGFDDGLRKAMKTETEMFFQTIVGEDRSVLDFLDARYTFLNEQLAKHYGIDGIQGGNFRRVTLVGDQRGGILSQASLLTVTSNPTRTSPVKRGKWVMENLLGTPLPPAPPNVPALSDDKKGPLVGTLRQRMEQHRANPVCAGCHSNMDPIGFGMENYDAVGKWRTEDGESKIDPSGVLPDGSKFSSPAQLKQILLSKKSQFVHCLSEKLMTYALGRGLERTDRCTLDGIVTASAKQGDRFSSLVAGIVQSDPFRKQRESGPTK